MNKDPNRRQSRVAIINNWVLMGKLKKNMKPREKRVYASQSLRCLFGFHVFQPHYLLYGVRQKDGIYKFCPFCHRVGRMLSKPTQLTTGMSSG